VRNVRLKNEEVILTDTEKHQYGVIRAESLAYSRILLNPFCDHFMVYIRRASENHYLEPFSRNNIKLLWRILNQRLQMKKHAAK